MTESSRIDRFIPRILNINASTKGVLVFIEIPPFNS
jgi:hypothetical protein